MRPIDATIKARALSKHQTVHNNNEHAMEIIVSRPGTPIGHQRFWQESIVTGGVTAVCTSVAIKRTGRWGETVYVAYVDSTGLLTVKSAPLRFPIREMSWTTVTTISGCAACALEFDGSFVQVGRHIEFRTEAIPWLFYTTTSGELKAGILGGSYETLVGANVTAVDAIRGVASKYKDIDQGLLVFYVIAGDLYYRDLIAGVWGDQTSVSIAPADIVSVRAERTFDYRIVLQVTDTSGKLYEIFTKMEASGWNGTEYAVQMASATIAVERTQISYHDYMGNDETIALIMVLPEVWQMSIYPPVLRKAWNVPIELETPYDPYDDDLDYGYVVVFEFNQIVRNAELFPADFKIEDDYGSTWFGQEAVLDGRFVTVYFNNFNNAENSITATALAGNLTNGYTDLVETSVEFDAEGLVQFYTEPPEFVSIWNTDSMTVLVQFSRPIVSVGAKEGFQLTGYEPSMSPDGDLIATDYGVDSVENLPAEVYYTDDFDQGTLVDVVNMPTGLELGR